jgi:hypothetical protein
MQEFEITVTQADGFLRMTIRGAGTRNNLLRTLERIIAETQSQDTWRVLLDATAAKGIPGAFDKFEIGVQLARAADRRLRLAVVARFEAVDHFFETVARNRGGAVRVFTDEAGALHWLLGAATGTQSGGAVDGS